MPIIQNFPVMHRDGNSYTGQTNGFNTYSASFNLSNNDSEGLTVHSEHVIDYAKQNLICELVEQKVLSFFTTVTVRGTFLRRTTVVDSNSIQLTIRGNKRICKQQISGIYWKQNEKNIYHQSGLIINDATTFTCKKEHGLSKLYYKQKVFFPKNAVVAHSGWNRFYDRKSLFILKSDEKQTERYFKSSIDNTEDVLRIAITLHENMYNDVGNEKEPAYSYVLCAALASALARIHEAYKASSSEYGIADDTLLERALPLRDFLKSERLPTWEDHDFNPAEAASKLFSIRS